MHRLSPALPLDQAVRACADDQLARGLGLLEREGLDLHERVHELRRMGKETRGLLRLVRDALGERYGEANARLRDGARPLGPPRDAAAAVETHDALVDALGEDQLAPYTRVREALVARREAAGEADLAAELDELRGRLDAVRAGLDDWQLPDDEGIPTLAQGYARTYGRARDRLADAVDAPTSEAWHTWRKRVKYHRYHVDLLAAGWPPVLEQREDLLHDLTDLLGDDHDLAVLRAALVGDGLDLDAVVRTGYVGLLDRRRAALQRAALPLGRRLLAAPVEEHVELVLGWWELAAAEARADTPDVAPAVVPADA